MDIVYYYNKFKFGNDIFGKLMKFRVKRVLLVSTFYDAYIFERDALINEQVFGEYQDLNLSAPPVIEAVPTGEEALKRLEEKKYDLVITTVHSGTVSSVGLLNRIKALHSEIPVFLLMTACSDLKLIDEQREENTPEFDEVFVWNGDAKLFLAMIKMAEDSKNIDYDTHKGLVRVILVVEDSVSFYSLFLPLLYEETMKQTQHLIVEELNERDRHLRMRARPKVILAKTYEEAEKYFDQYADDIVAVFSDTCFPHKGVENPSAGIELLGSFRERGSDVAFVLLSSNVDNYQRAQEANLAFLYKKSHYFLHRLRDFVVDNLGFGDFIFRDQQGGEIDRASYLAEFEEKLNNIPEESITYHASNNHFSTWLMARGEIEMAKHLRNLHEDDFESIHAMRQYLIDSILAVQRKRNRGEIVRFHKYSKPDEGEITRLAEGSLGGKGRGLAFLNSLFATMDSEDLFDGLNVMLPRTAVIGVSEYDRFIEYNNIENRVDRSLPDDEIDRIFKEAHLSDKLYQKLKRLLERIDYPLAVRSSSLLEDSYAQPFAGIYRTYMVPNNSQDMKDRLNQLCDAIKLIYSSVYSRSTGEYLDHIGHNIEEEKMAVVIQEIVGSRNDNYYYPHISGMAQSYNFYPVDRQKHSDGIVSLAIGLGKMVVEGGSVYRFCPEYPKVSIVSQQDLIQSSQKEFYALDMTSSSQRLNGEEGVNLVRLPLSKAEEHGRLNDLVSTYDMENNRLWPGTAISGMRIATFDNIIKYNKFPLVEVVKKILKFGEAAMGMPVEIEFAVDQSKVNPENQQPVFYLLQIRPLAVRAFNTTVNKSRYPEDEVLLYTEKGMGNGEIDNIRDIIICPAEKFNNTHTLEIRQDIENLNKKMKSLDRNYILIGPGRWGTNDRFLGVPVRFGQINKAQVIVESNIEGFEIEPSQGTHFFHNVVAMQMGYFSIPFRHDDNNFINYKLLKKMNVEEETEYFTHYHCEKCLNVKMDGKTGKAIISFGSED